MQNRTTNVLVFEIDRQRYGLLASDVREVLRSVTLVPMPRAPSIVEGLINVRGTVVPVLDIRARFRLPPKPAEPTDHLIVSMVGKRLVAIRVDHALEMISLSAGEIEDAAKIVSGPGCVAGVAKLPDGLVLVHDPATFLSEAESEEIVRFMAPLGPAEESS